MRLMHLVLLLLALLAAWSGGCGQTTEASLRQPVEQPQSTQTEQDSAAGQGIVTVNISNTGTPDSGATSETLLAQLAAQPAMQTETDHGAAGTRAQDTRAGYVVNATVNITTGGSTTGSQSATPAVSSSAQPGATVTQSPEQRPEASVPVAISAAAPGGAAHSSAAAAGAGGTVTLTPSQQAELNTLLQELRGAGTPEALQAATTALEQFWRSVTDPKPASP